MSSPLEDETYEKLMETREGEREYFCLETLLSEILENDRTPEEIIAVANGVRRAWTATDEEEV